MRVAGWQCGTAPRLNPSVPRCHIDPRRGKKRSGSLPQLREESMLPGTRRPGAYPATIACTAPSAAAVNLVPAVPALAAQASALLPCLTWPKKRSGSVDANPRLWVMVSGSIFHEHQACIGLHDASHDVSRAFPGSHSPVAPDMELTIAVAWYFLGSLCFLRQCSRSSYHCDRPAPAVWSRRAPQPHTDVHWLHPVDISI